MTVEQTAADFEERRARLVAKYRAKRQDRPIDRGETLDQFADRVFGSEAATAELIKYLRERTEWLASEPEIEEDAVPGRGR